MYVYFNKEKREKKRTKTKHTEILYALGHGNQRKILAKFRLNLPQSWPTSKPCGPKQQPKLCCGQQYGWIVIIPYQQLLSISVESIISTARFPKSSVILRTGSRSNIEPVLFQRHSECGYQSQRYRRWFRRLPAKNYNR